MNIPRRGALFLIIFFVSVYSIFASEAIAKESVIKLDVAAPQKISLMVGKSIVVETPRAVKRVSLAATAFADAIVLSPRQVYLTGKTPGLTNMILWEGDTVLAAFDVEVSPDI